MSQETLQYKVPSAFAAYSNLSPAKYASMYASSIADPEAFWGHHGQRLDWMTPYTKVKNVSWDKSNLSVKWYEDGVLNVTSNCLDRHLKTRGAKAAIIWEGDSPGATKTLTYTELHREVCIFANVMKAHGVKKGDRVTIYMPMILEAAFAMLACARIGAVHSVVMKVCVARKKFHSKTIATKLARLQLKQVRLSKQFSLCVIQKVM